MIARHHGFELAVGSDWRYSSIVSVLMVGRRSGASEADLAIPDLHAGTFDIFGTEVSAWNLLFYGALVICGTLGISLYLRAQIKQMPAHKSMLDIAEIIFQTCKTYLIQQGKFLLMLFVLIAVAISYYLLAFGRHARISDYRPNDAGAATFTHAADNVHSRPTSSTDLEADARTRRFESSRRVSRGDCKDGSAPERVAASMATRLRTSPRPCRSTRI